MLSLLFLNSQRGDYNRKIAMNKIKLALVSSNKAAKV